VGSKDRKQRWDPVRQTARMGSRIERKDGIQSKDRRQGWDPLTEQGLGPKDRKPRWDPRTECKDGIHGQKSRKGSKDRRMGSTDREQGLDLKQIPVARMGFKDKMQG
jgi:hypothetical protein